MPKAPFVQSNLGPSQRRSRSRTPTRLNSQPRSRTRKQQCNGFSDFENGATREDRRSHKNEPRLGKRYGQNDELTNGHENEERSRHDAAHATGDVSLLQNTYSWSKLNLSALERDDAKSEVVLSMRQTNVLLSPRVYDSVSVPARGSEEQLSIKQLSVKKSHIQQVTVGPVESDCISDLLFMAENHDPCTFNVRPSKSESDIKVGSNGITNNGITNYGLPNSKTGRNQHHSETSSRNYPRQNISPRMPTNLKHKKTSPRERSPNQSKFRTFRNPHPRPGQRSSDGKENDYTMSVSHCDTQTSFDDLHEYFKDERSVPHSEERSIGNPRSSRKKILTEPSRDIESKPDHRQQFEVFQSPKQHHTSDNNSVNAPNILYDSSMLPRVNDGVYGSVSISSNGIQREIHQADMEHLINQRFLAGLKASESSFLRGLKSADKPGVNLSQELLQMGVVEDSILSSSNSEMDKASNSQQIVNYMENADVDISDDSLHVSELDAPDEDVIPGSNQHKLQNHGEFQLQFNSFDTNHGEYQLNSLDLNHSEFQFNSPEYSPNSDDGELSEESHETVERYLASSNHDLNHQISPEIDIEGDFSPYGSRNVSNENFFNTSMDNFTSKIPNGLHNIEPPVLRQMGSLPFPSYGIHSISSPKKQVHFKDPISISTQISPRPIISLEDLGLEAEPMNHNKNEITGLKMNGLSQESRMNMPDQDSLGGSYIPTRQLPTPSSSSRNKIIHAELKSSTKSSSRPISKRNQNTSNKSSSSIMPKMSKSCTDIRLSKPNLTSSQRFAPLPTKSTQIQRKKSSTIQPQASRARNEQENTVQKPPLPQPKYFYTDKVSIGNSALLRGQRLQNVIERSPPNERNNIILKSRYFRIWRENVRLLNIIKSKKKLKLMKASSFHNLTSIAKHFLSWRSLIIRQRLAAEELNKHQLLRKGFSALRWAVNSKNARRNQAITARRNLKIKQCFSKWKKKYRVRRHHKLKSLFNHWKTRCKNKIIIELFKTRRDRIVSLQVFFFWRERFHSSCQLKIATEHCNFVSIRRVWHVWRISTAERVVRKSQCEVAQIKHETWTLSRTWKRWNNTTIQKQYADLYNRKKVLSSSIKVWKHSTSLSRIYHRKEIASARKIRRKYLLKIQFSTWVSELKAKKLKKKRELKNIRHCILLWKARVQKHRIICSEIESHHNQMLLKRTFQAIQENADSAKRRRNEAIQKVQQSALNRTLMSWHQFTMRKITLGNMQKTFQVQKAKKSIQFLFQIWKIKLHIIQSAQEQCRQWTLSCVRKAADKWLHLLRLEQMDKKCERLEAKFKKGRLKNRFKTWKRQLNKERKSEQRAADGQVVLLREKMRRILRNWNIRTQESMNIKPLIERMDRRRVIRCFDAWLLLRNRQVMKENMIQQIQTNSMNQCFKIWKEKLNDRNNMKIAEEMHEILIKKRTLRAWRKFVSRCHGYALVSDQYHRMLIQRLFYTWATKTSFKQIEESRRLHEHFLRQVNAHQILLRWNSAAKERRQTEEDNILSFKEVHDFSLKRSKFKYWINSTKKHQRAKEFASMNTKKKIKEIFIAWHRLAVDNLRQGMEQFSFSIRSLRKPLPPFDSASNGFQAPKEVKGNDVITQTSFDDGNVTKTKESSVLHHNGNVSSSSETGFSETSPKIIQPKPEKDFIETSSGVDHAEPIILKQNIENFDAHSVISSYSVETQSTGNSILRNGCADSGILLRDYVSTVTSEQDDRSSVNSVRVNGSQQTDFIKQKDACSNPADTSNASQTSDASSSTPDLTLEDLERSPQVNFTPNGEFSPQYRINSHAQFSTPKLKNTCQGTYDHNANQAPESPGVKTLRSVAISCHNGHSPILHDSKNHSKSPITQTNSESYTNATTQLPMYDDPYLQPVLSDFSHMSSLPIDESYTRTHVPEKEDFYKSSMRPEEITNDRNARMDESLPSFYHEIDNISLNETPPGDGVPSIKKTIASHREKANPKPLNTTPNASTVKKNSKIPIPTSKILPKTGPSSKNSSQQVGMNTNNNPACILRSEKVNGTKDLVSPRQRHVCSEGSPTSHLCTQGCQTNPKTVLNHEDNIETAKIITPRKICDRSTESEWCEPEAEHTQTLNYDSEGSVPIYPILSSTMKDNGINTEKFDSTSYSADEEETSMSVLSSLSSSDVTIDDDIRLEPATIEILSKKPKPLLPIHPVLKDSFIPTTEWLVRLAVIRMRYRPLAFAFHQWRLLIHAKKWEKEMLSHMKERNEVLTQQQYLRNWKTNCNKVKAAKNYLRNLLMKKHFTKWLEWKNHRKDIQRMKQEADRTYSSNVLKSAMNIWNEKLQHRQALLEILNYWKDRTKQHLSPRSMDERANQRMDEKLLSDSFVTWKLKADQIALADKHRKMVMFAKILKAWNTWASKKAELSGRVREIKMHHLKRRNFNAWKNRASVTKRAEVMQKRSIRNWISSLIGRWHRHTEVKQAHNSALSKISAQNRLSTVQSCLNQWKLEFTKRKLAGVMQRRTLMRKFVHAWRDVTMECTADRQKQQHIRKIVAARMKCSALAKWRIELSMKAIVDSARDRRTSLLLWRTWSLWRERVALKRASQAYFHFLKRRTFNAWLKFLKQKKNSDEKARTVLLKWHEMVVRNQILSNTADQFQLNSRTIATEITFNTWVIACDQTRRSKSYYKNQLIGKCFSAIQDCAKREKFLKKKQNNFTRQKTKELFAFSWHKWKYRYQMKLRNSNTIEHYRRAVSHRLLKKCWSVWSEKKDERDAGSRYRKTLVNKCFTRWSSEYMKLKKADELMKEHQDRRLKMIIISWWSHFLIVKNEKKVITDLKESRNRIRTISTFMVWLKSYRNNKIAEKFHEKNLKRNALQSLKVWRTENVRLKNCYSQAKLIVENILLKFYFTQWKSMFRKVRMLEVTCDRMREVKTNNLLKSCWKKWFKAKENRDLKRRHERDLAFDVIAKWRRYAINRVTERRIKEDREVMVERFQHKWTCRRCFIHWKRNYQVNWFKSQHRHRELEKSWNMWSSRTAMILFAIQMNEQWAIRKHWHWWRLEHVTRKSTNEATEQMNRDMTKTAFRLWRAYTYKKLTGQRYCSPLIESTRTLTPRKRSRIPVLKK